MSFRYGGARIAQVFLLASGVSATEMPAWAECQDFRNPKDVISCALVNHPEIREAEARVGQGEETVNVAAQVPNPELNSQMVTASTTSGRLNYAEFNLAQTIELGGKLSARREQAQAQHDLIKTELLKAKEQVYITTFLALYRLRQLKVELEILADSLSTFSRIQKLFLSRPRLSPDQRISLQILELARGDYRGRKAGLESEAFSHNKTLELATSRDLSGNLTILPQRRASWPEMGEEELKLPPQGSTYQSALGDLQFAQTTLSVEHSLSWPDLKIGPTFETQSQGGISHQAYGLNFTLPLPLFHFNGAGTARAGYGVKRFEIALDAARKELLDQREIYLHRYSSAVRILKSSPSEAEVLRQRKLARGLFDQGLVSGALVIEAHRQVLDFTKSQNEQELTALEALAKLYALDGRLFQESL